MSVAALAIEWQQSKILQALLASRWLWCIATVAALALREWAGDPHALRFSLGDTDDATRLVQVREFMAGAPWLDTTLHRFGGATPLVSHWSRLIDVPIALIIAAAGFFVSPSKAEMAARLLWPSLLLVLFLRLLLREAEIRAGQAGALMLLIFSATCLSGLYQFSLGRIDHHNVMIIGAVGGLVIMARALEDPRQGWYAGSLLGLALAIGYEPLALIIPAMAIATILATLKPAWLEGMRNATVALTATLGAAVFSTIPPGRWFTVTCDSLSTNMVLLTCAGAAGLWYVHAHRSRYTAVARLAIMAVAGGVGTLLYVAIEPVCMSGPFAQVNAAVGTIWLDHVLEAQSVFQRSHDMPMAMLVFVTACIIGIAAQSANWWRNPTSSNLFLLIAVVIALPPAIWQVKLTFYAVWLATFTLAIAVAEMKGTDDISPLTMRLTGATFTNQGTLALLATPLLVAAGLTGAASTAPGAQTDLCRETPTIQSLRILPKGFIIADIDSGPFIVALTAHDVLSAPYHRIDNAILAEHSVLSGPVAGAESRVRQEFKSQQQDNGGSYIVLCSPPLGAASTTTNRTATGARHEAAAAIDPVDNVAAETTNIGRSPKSSSTLTAQPEPQPVPPILKGSRGDKATLAGALLSGVVIDYLEPVDVNAPRAALKVWRLLPPR